MGKKKRNLRIHREGRGIILGLTFLIFAINVPIYLFMEESRWVFAITLLLSAALLVFVTYFFRNPTRIIEVEDPNFLIAPADGRIVVVEPTMENEYFHEKRLQVSIFMSPFNVHANWYPIEGTVLVSEHQKGSHKGAWLPNQALRTSAHWWSSKPLIKCKLLYDKLQELWHVALSPTPKQANSPIAMSTSDLSNLAHAWICICLWTQISLLS